MVKDYVYCVITVCVILGHFILKYYNARVRERERKRESINYLAAFLFS